ncbi:MAG: hypothetical protein ACM3SY_01960 [Candidatus Omnitrophota bacterium]
MNENKDTGLIERAKTFEFVSLWWEWLMRYQDDRSDNSPPASPYPNSGYGYRAGQLWQYGAHRVNYPDDWTEFFDRMLYENGLSRISIDALYCYERHASCRRYIDTGGRDYRFP